jgi:hypothetical protein
VVHAAGGIDLGQDSEIAGGIHLNGGDDDLLVMSTAGGEVRLNGAVTLESHVQIDTSDGGGAAGGEIRFTRNAPVDSQTGENNVLTLSAGTDGTVNFNANLGATVALGQFERIKTVFPTFTRSVDYIKMRDQKNRFGLSVPTQAND